MEYGRGRRRSLRRALSLECALQSELWDGLVSFGATDVSEEGLWVDTPYALDLGEELVLSFLPPGAPPGQELWAVAEVARVGLWRRRSDPGPPGMGLAFRYVSAVDRRFLARALVGHPPRLPRRRGPPPLPGARARLQRVERRRSMRSGLGDLRLGLEDLTFLD
jgi:hypothetical protein